MNSIRLTTFGSDTESGIGSRENGDTVASQLEPEQSFAAHTSHESESQDVESSPDTVLSGNVDQIGDSSSAPSEFAILAVAASCCFSWMVWLFQ